MAHGTDGPGRNGIHSAGPAGVGRDDPAHNLFFALMPDEPTRARIGEAVAALRSAEPGLGRWLEPRRYHVTLHFLGHHRPLPATLVAQAQAAADAVVASAFDLVIDRTGSFSRAKVGWLGCRVVPEGLIDLHSALRQSLRSAGVAMDESAHYTPHVTVLRNLRGRMPEAEIEPTRWTAREFALVDSRHGAPVEYRVIGRWPLG